MLRSLVVLLLSITCLQPSIFAKFSPVGFSFTHKGEAGQFPHESWDVYGARFNLLSAKHNRVVGLDMGVLSETKKLSAGVQMSVYNLNEGETRIFPLQLGLIANANYGGTKGLGMQASIFANYNKGPAHIVGFQMAIANLGRNNIYGMQMGLYNRADRIVGLQLGVVNYCSNLHGVQIGLLNVCKSCLIGLMPGINIGFF
jgi:hypothetical protein